MDQYNRAGRTAFNGVVLEANATNKMMMWMAKLESAITLAAR
jgi:hypothetical protein